MSSQRVSFSGHTWKLEGKEWVKMKRRTKIFTKRKDPQENRKCHLCDLSGITKRLSDPSDSDKCFRPTRPQICVQTSSLNHFYPFSPAMSSWCLHANEITAQIRLPWQDCKHSSRGGWVPHDLFLEYLPCALIWGRGETRILQICVWRFSNPFLLTEWEKVVWNNSLYKSLCFSKMSSTRVREHRMKEWILELFIHQFEKEVPIAILWHAKSRKHPAVLAYQLMDEIHHGTSRITLPRWLIISLAACNCNSRFSIKAALLTLMSLEAPGITRHPQIRVDSHGQFDLCVINQALCYTKTWIISCEAINEIGLLT